MAVELLPKAWDKLPGSIQSQIIGSRPHRTLQRQIAYREPLAELEIAPTEDYSFTMLVPERLNPWWLDYDRSEPHSCHEPITTRTLIDEVSPGDTVWDMGSQWGYFAVEAADLNESPSDVHVFDMEPYHCLQIERTSDALYGANGLDIVKTFISDSSGPGETQPDDYAADKGAPDVVKIDIEGAEVDAIAGMNRTIEADHPTLIIEVHPNKIQQNFERETADLLSYLVSEYDDIQYCENFREQDSSWTPFDVSAAPSPGGNGMDGGVDRDAYQLLCR